MLTGVSYTIYRNPDDPWPEGFAGDDDVWHLHDMMKIAMTATEGRPLMRWITNRRIERGRTQWSEDRSELTMVHAWVWLENPDGVFAQDHRLIPYVRLGLPAEWGHDASLDAAYGVSLLAEDGCTGEVRRTSWLAGTSWRQRRELRDACAEAKATVREALSALLDGDAVIDDIDAADVARFNGITERAWGEYLTAREKILTSEQRERLSVAIEHPHGQPGHRD